MMNDTRRPPPDELIALENAFIVRRGYTTALSAAGNLIIDAGLIGIGANSLLNMLVVLYPGDFTRADSMYITAFNNATGQLTLDKFYKLGVGGIPAGVQYYIISVSTALAAILAALAVPPVDSLINLLERDVLGNKEDTATTTVDNTSSSMRYLKGIVNTVVNIFTRVTDIYNLVIATLTDTETGGTLTTDGAVQILWENNAPFGIFEPVVLKVDFTNQTAGETVVIRMYERLAPGGGLVEFDHLTFAGVQDPLGKYIDLKPNRFGVRITIERTAGVAQDYVWEIVSRE